jgi:4a-hydroxytetrahydrobiopterin dehydratase
MALLDETSIERELAALPGWRREPGPPDRIARLYAFAGFPAAIAFVNRVAALAEEADHHPDIHVSYDKVRLVLWSHDSGGLTARDFRLARRIDS